MVRARNKVKENGCHNQVKETKVLLSTDFLEWGAPRAKQETIVELWGLLSDWSRDREVSEIGSPGPNNEAAEDRFDDLDDVQEEQLPSEGLQLSHELLGQMEVSEVAVGAGHCVLVSSCGRAFGYGCNARGQLGIGGEELESSSLAELHLKSSNYEGTREMKVLGAACGSEHTLLLARSPSGESPRQIFVCGAWEALGLPHSCADQFYPTQIPLRHDVTAIAARGGASCCTVSEGESETCRHLLYLWGEVDCCPCPDLLERPTPCFRLPRMTRKLGLGGSFGLVLDITGNVYAWGDGTYGELGGAVMDFGGWPLTNRSFTDPQALPVPGKVTLPRHTQDKEAGEEGPKGVKDIACGERHSLLLDDAGNLYAFGENLAGQCGVLEAVGSGHIFGCTVQQPRPVPIEAASLSDVTPTQERGEKVFAGKWHSAMVTADHRLYIWGHPSNRKLGHVGFNHDGTEAGEDPGIGAKQKSKARPPGVAVRSALRDAVRRPRMVFALLHRRVRTLGLGEECTVIVHGDGKEPEESQEVQDVQVQSEAIPDLEAALPVEAEKESHPLEEAQPPKDATGHALFFVNARSLTREIRNS